MILIKQLKMPNNTHISTHYIQVLRNGLLCGSRRFCLREPLHRAGRRAQCLGGWAKTSRTGDFLHVFLVIFTNELGFSHEDWGDLTNEVNLENFSLNF